ncbi:MAG: hypothetical protein RL700_213, partial [Pseudomonadota bacterium]
EIQPFGGLFGQADDALGQHNDPSIQIVFVNRKNASFHVGV